ncbi:MAG: hypothetical protein WD897_01735 [Parcubacteria group bacterium]
MTKNKILISAIILFLFAAIGVAVLFSAKTHTALTVEDLPSGVEYVRHPDEELQAETEEKITMRHYATPDAVKVGGPSFGIIGYRIVSIEYEIPVLEIPTKTVGQEFPGYLLSLPEFKNIRYDHFHISYQKEGLAHNEGEEAHGGSYSIHFMLIPHEEEIKFGMVCE